MKKYITIILMAFTLGFINAQNFTYSSTTCSMVGTPSITFQWNITFSNAGSNSVTVKFERLAKSLPPYWSQCICYITCNPPEFDNFDIHLAPFTSSILSVLFKTDSVNPGIATTDVRIFESGMESAADTLHLKAETVLPNGIEDIQTVSDRIQIRSVNEGLFIECKDLIEEIELFGYDGKKLMQKDRIYSREFLMTGTLPAGVYLLRAGVHRTGHITRKVIIAD